jgi:N-acetyl-gamma-glutamylphosphate reductase
MNTMLHHSQELTRILTHTHTREQIRQWIVWAVILMSTVAFMPEVRAFFQGALAAVSGYSVLWHAFR